MEIYLKFDSDEEREKYIRALAGNRVPKDAELDDLQAFIEEQLQDTLEQRYHQAMYRHSQQQRKSRLSDDTLARLGLTRAPENNRFARKGTE